MATLTDQIGRTVNLPENPQRIVSLVPSQSELLFDLGLDDKVQGITWFCVYPEDKFKKKPKIGGTKQLKLDKIRELEPDLIIGNKEENEKEQVEELAKDYPVWVTHISDLSSAYQMIEDLGKITGTSQKALEILKKVKGQFDQLRLESKPEKVLYMIWRKPWMAAGGDTFINEMLEVCGWENVLKDTHRYPEISEEDLQKLSPDLIFLSSEPYPFREKHFEEFQKRLPNAQIKLVEGDKFSWYGSRLLKSGTYFQSLIKELYSSAD